MHAILFATIFDTFLNLEELQVLAHVVKVVIFQLVNVMTLAVHVNIKMYQEIGPNSHLHSKKNYRLLGLVSLLLLACSVEIRCTSNSQPSHHLHHPQATQNSSPFSTGQGQKGPPVASSPRLLTSCTDPCLTCRSWDPGYCYSCVNNTYFLDWRDDACYPCPTQLDNCATCQGGSYNGPKCTSCIDNTVCLSMDRCVSCSTAMTNCATCLDSSTCLTCTDDFNYVDTDAQCHPCSDSMDYCLVCTAIPSASDFNCSQCISDAYFLNSSGVCESCQCLMPFCINCTNGTYCLNCVNNSYAYNQSLNKCVPCDQMFQNCTRCTYTECIRCQEGYMLYNGACSCPVGWKVAGLCTTIAGCIQPVNYPDGARGCTACNQTDENYNNFQPLPADGICKCMVGQLIGLYCIDEIGCVAAIKKDAGLPVCIFCNTVANFQKTPNLAGHCLCIPKTEPNGLICSDICGDGYLLGLTLSCDDGNLINGDGCSSTCQSQTGYRCQNGSSTTASQCVYIGRPLVLSLDSIVRSQDYNHGTFVFNVQPALTNFPRMKLQTLVVLNCNSTYTVSSISYEDGRLAVTADYSENMEERACTLTVQFDNHYIISPTYTLKFQAISDDYPLVIIEDLSAIRAIRFSFQVLSYIVLIIFIVSLPHKMIGPELLVSCQMVYLSNCLYQQPSLFSLTIKHFPLITGGWSIFTNATDEDLLSPFTHRVSISPFFLQDALFIILIILVSMVFCIVLMFCNSLKGQDKRRSLQSLRKREYSKSEKAIKFVYYLLLYPVTAGFFVTLSLAGFINNLARTPTSEPRFNAILNSCAQGFTWFAIGVVLAIEFTNLGTKEIIHVKLSGLQNVKTWYIPLFLFRMLVLTLLFEAGIWVSFQILLYPFIGVMVFYWLLIMIGRPYQRTICNITILVAQSTAIFAAVLPVIECKLKMSQSIWMYLTYGILSLVCVTILLSLFRVVLLYYTICRNLFQKEERELCDSDVIENRKERGDEEEAQEVIDLKNQSKNLQSAFSQQQERRKHRNSLEQLQYRLRRIDHSIPTFENAINSILAPREEVEDNLELKIIKNRLREDLMSKKKKKGAMILELE